MICVTQEKMQFLEKEIKMQILFLLVKRLEKNEDLHGEPFIGTAGKKLDDALKKCWIDKKQCIYHKYCKM